MCGIAGYFGLQTIPPERVTNTLKRMKNRGPDSSNVFLAREGENTIALLHSRLAIIDLDPRSNQPFRIGPVTLVFNGEIYNYVELRERLKRRGIAFRTTSDTEVLLQSYLAFGEQCVEDLEGMWAFALYDSRAAKLVLSRDRFAEKPLYYTLKHEGIYFGSEVKFLESLSGELGTVNEKQLLRYLVNGYKSLFKQPETYYTDIHELGYASLMVVDRNRGVKTTRYWTPRYTPRPMSKEEAIEGVRERFLNSIRLRLRSDVPLAFCLSGGVDSGAIVSVAAKCFNCNVHTFSLVDRDERYNELKNIEATVRDLGCRSTVLTIPQAESFSRLQELIAYHDAPVATITYYIHSLLSEAIREQGYKVVFSGTSADELFTGYYDHFNLHLYEMRNHPEYRRFLADWYEHTGKFVRNPYLQDPELYIKDTGCRAHIYLNNTEFASYLKIPFAEEFVEVTFTDESLLRNRMLNELFYESTPVILHEDDLNSMKYSIENRSPYLDSELFAFAYSIPNEHLITNGFGKYTLREALRGVLNDEVRLDRQKKGFNASVQSVFNLKSPELRAELLDDSEIYTLVDRSRIEHLLEEEKPLPNSFSKFLFSFMSAKFFLDERKRRVAGGGANE